MVAPLPTPTAASATAPTAATRRLNPIVITFSPSPVAGCCRRRLYKLYVLARGRDQGQHGVHKSLDRCACRPDAYVDAMTAVLVHGNPETHAIWRPLVERLERDDVVTPQLPGFGAPAPADFGA